MSTIPESYEEYITWILAGNEHFDNIVNHVGCDLEWLIRNISWLCNKRIVNKITHCNENSGIGPHYNVYIGNGVFECPLYDRTLYDRRVYNRLKAAIDRNDIGVEKTGLPLYHRNKG
jgi:hypothetical protein